MRKSREEAARTRQQIVTTAAAEFRRRGIVASGLNELMSAAGLTRGGFYKHFESKDQLVAEAVAESARSVIVEKIGTAAARGKNPGAEYLSAHHRDHPDAGCPLSALGAELARADAPTRAAATDGVRQLIDIMTRQFAKTPSATARRRALVAVSTMIGAMTLSRIVDDHKLSQEILREAEKSLAE